MQAAPRFLSDPESLAYLGVSLVVVAVGLSVAGVQLLVTCEPGAIAGNAVTCSYPFQGFGLAFLYAGGMVASLGFVAFARQRIARGVSPSWSPHVVGAMIAAGCSFLYLIALFLTGLL